MDLVLVKESFGHTQKRGKWVLLLAAMGFTGYGAYNIYHLPYVAEKRKRLLKLVGALISIAEAVSDSAEAIGVVSKDLKEFVQSGSDQIPNSVRQVSKVARSEEFSESVVQVTRALTDGISKGYRSGMRKDDGMSVNSSFLDQVSDKLFSTAGSGFASVVVGSFAKHLVMAYSDFATGNNSKSAAEWVDVVCSEKSREFIGDCAQLFVSTAVTVYLEKTMHINTFDELFSGLTNPKHERKMKEMVASVCNGAVETLVKTSHQVLTSGSSGLKSNSSDPYLAIDEFENQNSVNEELHGEAQGLFDENENGGWVNKASSTLAVPSNRKFVLDLIGRVTFETIKSFLDFLVEKLCEAMRSSLGGAREAVIDRTTEVTSFVTEKSFDFVTVCVSLCLRVLGSVWFLVPA